jgi:hypothetical protein
MRVFSRIALALVAAAVLAQPAFSQPLQSKCPLTLVATNPPSSGFAGSPHGVFRSGNQVFVLRGQTLTTYTVTDLGDMQIAREDFLSSLAGRNIGATAFSNGFLYVSSEGGIEIFDLRNVSASGSAPVSVARISGVNYRRLAVSGSTLAALFPATDMPCAPSFTCPTSVDLYNVANTASPFRVSSIPASSTVGGGFNDVAFNFGNLIITGTGGTVAYDVTNQSSPRLIGVNGTVGTFLTSNGTNFLAVGSDMAIVTFALTSPFSVFQPLTYHSLATLQVGRANPIVFHPQAFIDDTNLRLITMVDELDPERLQPARTIAFDVFDYSVPMIEGRDPRTYESVSYLSQDEVKFNPVAVGPLVYVVGEVSGLQTYGDCGQMAGKIETANIASFPCPATTVTSSCPAGQTCTEMHGWVTSAQKMTGVELFLDNTSEGPATIDNTPRQDVPSKTPVFTWRIGVALGPELSGTDPHVGVTHLFRAVGTDVNNNRRQFASIPIYFPPNWQQFCVGRRRSVR